MSTEIQWTWKFDEAGKLISKGETWNFLSGCDKVSPACDNCYAKTLHDQRRKALLEGHAMPEQYREPFEVVQVHPSRLEYPLSWGAGRRIFVNSVSDTFHKDVPLDILAKAFAVMAIARRHTFLVLTKRIKRAESILNEGVFPEMVASEVRKLAPVWGGQSVYNLADKLDAIGNDSLWPLPNVWLGVSVENQAFANARIDHLMETPAAVRFISAEPLLGRLKLRRWMEAGRARRLDWVIGGGESGKNARATDPDHARSLRDECAEMGVPFFWKQNGEWVPVSGVGGGLAHHYFDERRIVARVRKKKAGRMLDGVEWNQYPKEIKA